MKRTESGDVDSEIRRFWNDQGEQFGGDPRATTPDHWMRRIEIDAIAAVLRNLPEGSTVLDIGCGNGYSTLAVAERNQHLQFVGADYAPSMIVAAQRLLEEAIPSVAERVVFEEADVRDLSRYRGSVSAVISDRCLINLPTIEEQIEALAQIGQVLDAGGLYVAVENFIEGQNNLNALREKFGLGPIAVRWHNRFFTEEQFLEATRPWFALKEIVPISSLYYLVTRIVYSRLCQLDNREPDYDHPIYEIATRLPFEGNYGPVKLVTLVRSG